MSAVAINVEGPFDISPLSGLESLTRGGAVERVLSAMADTFLRITWDNFGPSGENRPFEWAPLSRPYQEQIDYFGPPKLILSGELIASVRELGRSGNSVTVGSDLPYAAIHQLGGENNYGHVPARPYFPVYDSPAGGEAVLTEYARDRIDAAVQRECDAILSGA